MTGWNMPPGCNPIDVDRAMGELTHCCMCHREVYIEDCTETADGEFICNKQACQDPDYLYDRKKDEEMERKWEEKDENV